MRAPSLVDVLLNELDGDALDTLAERLAPRIAARLPDTQTSGWLDSTAAAAYLGITRNALRKLTAARTIPFEQDGPGCKCYFQTVDLDAWRRGERQPIASKSLPNSHHTDTNHEARANKNPD